MLVACAELRYCACLGVACETLPALMGQGKLQRSLLRSIINHHALSCKLHSRAQKICTDIRAPLLHTLRQAFVSRVFEEVRRNHATSSHCAKPTNAMCKLGTRVHSVIPRESLHVQKVHTEKRFLCLVSQTSFLLMLCLANFISEHRGYAQIIVTPPAHPPTGTRIPILTKYYAALKPPNAMYKHGMRAFRNST